jgi:hypothetical protein
LALQRWRDAKPTDNALLLVDQTDSDALPGEGSELDRMQPRDGREMTV